MPADDQMSAAYNEADRAQLMVRYRELRKLSTAINEGLVRTLTKDVIQEGGRKLGLMEGNMLVFDSEDQTSVLMDYCIYNVRRNGMNAVQRCLAESPPPAGSKQMLLLQAKARARYSIFQVRKVIEDVGVELLDVFRRERAFVVDVGLSHTAAAGVMLASRLIPMGDFWITGGAVLAFPPDAGDELRRRLPSLLGPGELDWDDLPLDQEADLVAAIISMSLRHHRGVETRYEEPDEKPPSTRPRKGQPYIGRNDPCPCGSGKRYKKCCGR